MLPPNNQNHQKRSSIFGLHGLLDYIEGRKQLFAHRHNDIVNNSQHKVANLADRKAFIHTIKEDYNKPIIIRKRINKKYIQALIKRKQNQI